MHPIVHLLYLLYLLVVDQIAPAYRYLQALLHQARVRLQGYTCHLPFQQLHASMDPIHSNLKQKLAPYSGSFQQLHNSKTQEQHPVGLVTILVKH